VYSDNDPIIAHIAHKLKQFTICAHISPAPDVLISLQATCLKHVTSSQICHKPHTNAMGLLSI